MEDFMDLLSVIEIPNFDARYMQFSLEFYICEILLDFLVQNMYRAPYDMLSWLLVVLPLKQGWNFKVNLRNLGKMLLEFSLVGQVRESVRVEG